MPGIGVAIPAYNRPEYLKPMLRNFRRSLFPEGTTVVIIDDGSDDPRALELIHQFSLPQTPVHKIMEPRHDGFGVHRTLRKAWDFLADECGCTHLVNVDSDALVKRNWLLTLQSRFARLRPRYGPLILTGFNVPGHRATELHRDYRVKESIGGVNTFFDVDLYHEMIRENMRFDPLLDKGWDWYVVERMRELNYPMLCTRPSVVQHIGKRGYYSKPRRYDRACDFTSLQRWSRQGKRWLKGAGRLFRLGKSRSAPNAIAEP